mgnify:CR=1 FL=1
MTFTTKYNSALAITRAAVFTTLGVVTITLGLNVNASQAQSAQELLTAMKGRMKGVSSYKASMRIKLDIPFLKAPESTATMYFKAPDKTHVDAPGFAMLPKRGADVTIQRVLDKPYVAVDAGRESFQGVQMRKVKILPTEEGGDIAVATVWIDTTQNVPRKVVSTTKQGGTITAELVFDDARARAFCLPSYLKLMFDIGNYEMSKVMSGDIDKPATQTEKPKEKTTQAVVEIWYSDYKLNVPIADAVFED